MMDYLTIDDVLMLHKDLISQYGGDAALRDKGVLEAALFRAQSTYYKDVIEKAASLWESLIRGRPFMDGNRRIAFAASYVFLKINGVTISPKPDKAWQFITTESQRDTLSFEQLVKGLRASIAR